MILVLNAGSSSLKYKLFGTALDAIAEGGIERIGEAASHARLETGTKRWTADTAVGDIDAALKTAFGLMRDAHLLDRSSAVTAVGHRVVHGGETFGDAVVIDEHTAAAIEALEPLAPLHNPANLAGIRAAQKRFPSAVQVAVFDTAFHRTLPPKAYRYAVSETFYADEGIRRYGFHGTSHAYVAQRAAAILERPIDTLHLVTLHLGNGASACAVARGKSIETSMGFTPLEGLVMGTRSGDIDPGIFAYLARRRGFDAQTAETLLNRRSGLFGLCGTNDMRDIEARRRAGDPDAVLAFDVFVHRIRKYVGAYAAVLGRLDALVFTGGIGEHSAAVREAVCEDLGILGIKIDREKNRMLDGPGSFHDTRGNVALLCVPTDEEYAIAEQTRRKMDTITP